MRLIDADALLLNAEQYRCGRGEYSRMVDVWHIDNAPTIEAAPVRYARWEPVSLDDQYEGCFKCSACKVEQYFGSGYPSYYDGSYCPNCGASMKGMKDETY